MRFALVALALLLAGCMGEPAPDEAEPTSGDVRVATAEGTTGAPARDGDLLVYLVKAGRYDAWRAQMEVADPVQPPRAQPGARLAGPTDADAAGHLLPLDAEGRVHFVVPTEDLVVHLEVTGQGPARADCQPYYMTPEPTSFDAGARSNVEVAFVERCAE